MTLLTKEPRSKTCPICSSSFQTFNVAQKYCGYSCANKARTTKQTSTLKSRESKTKAAFKKQYSEAVGKVLLKCSTCKEPYERYASHIKFRGSNYCSVECKKVGQITYKTKPQLTKKLDAVYSQYIRLSASKNGKVQCVSCGDVKLVKEMQNGHYVSRQYHATRWLDKNCHPQCYRCNVAFEGNYVHYTKYMIDTYGAEVIDELIELSKQTPNFSKIELQEKIDFYTNKVKVLLDN